MSRLRPTSYGLPAAVALALLHLGASGLAAQAGSTAMVHGVVRDSLDSPIGAAAVQIRHVPTGAVRAVATDSMGRYIISDLRPGGPYAVRATSIGFAASERTEIHLSVSDRLELDFRLSAVPIVLAGIEARAEAATRTFNTARTGPSLHIDTEIIEAQPTIERNFLELARISPLVHMDKDGAMSISGQNTRYNSIMIDGAILQDVFGASSSGIPGADARSKPIPIGAVQEFQVRVAPFDARDGGFTGGLVTAVTKSGTNEWRGGAFGHFRDERLFGELVHDGVDYTPSDYRKQIWGFDIGGPIQVDRAHLFLATEFEERREPTPGLTLGMASPREVGLAPDSAARLAGILRERYGMDPGTPGPVTLENPLANVFGRFDLQIDDRNTLTLRHNYSGAARDAAPNRLAFGAYEFSSSGYRIESGTHATAARLETRPREGLSNEVLLNYQRTRDRLAPRSRAPQIDVDLWSYVDAEQSATTYRTVRAGAPYFMQRNELDQDVLQLSDALTVTEPGLRTTFGLGLEHFRFAHRYLPGARGQYFFWSPGDLERNVPHRYQINSLLPGTDPEVRFSVVQPALFVQREWTAPDGLVMHFGVRVEKPYVLGTPERNLMVEDSFDLRTDRLPKTGIFISPRLGLNWQSEKRYRTQLRGGFGAFTGRLPYVWLANAYAYSGLRTALLVCENALASDGSTIRLTPDMTVSGAPPTACADGREASADRDAFVLAFAPEFKYPKEAKVSVGIDQQVPGGFIAGVETLLVFSLHQIHLEDVNIAETRSTDASAEDQGFGERRKYGSPSPDGYAAGRRDPRFAHVVAMRNRRAENESYALTFNLQRAFGEYLDLSASYSYSRSMDTQSLVSVDGFANFASVGIGVDPTLRGRAPSAFDRPHKVVGSLRARLPRGPELSLVYVGSSGTAYSYVYGGDVNGDGYSGVGVPLDASNDLVYVPSKPSEVPGNIGTQLLMGQLVEMEPCLREARGEILERNTCRMPWTNQLDARIRHEVRIGRFAAELSGDLVNVLNLLNAEWGRVWHAPASVPILDIPGRDGLSSSGGSRLGSLVAHYAGPIRRDASGVHPVLPYTLQVPASQWQAQLGVQLRF